MKEQQLKMKKQQLKMDLLVIEDALETHSQNCGLDYGETYGMNFSRLKSLLENHNMINNEMSKSIYEEALEYARILNALPSVTSRDQMLAMIEQALNQALNQTQKQEKLLELYRELMTVKDESISLLFIGNYNNDMEEIETSLERQIKELENDNT